MRGLREWFQNEHRATTRAIRCAQSDEIVARAHFIDVHEILRLHRHMQKYQKGRFTMFYLRRSQLLFCRGLQSISLASEVLYQEIIIMSKIKHDDSFTNAIFDAFKTSFKFTKCCDCHQNGAPKACLILTTPSNIFWAASTKSHDCHRLN